MKRDTILKSLLERLKDENKKKLKIYIMPNYLECKKQNKNLFPHYWNNALTAWKQMKVFKLERQDDQWFASLPELDQMPHWPEMKEMRENWRLKHLLSVLDFKQKVQFISNIKRFVDKNNVINSLKTLD